MAAYLLRRLLQAVIVMLVMTMLVFAGIFIVGNPADILIDPEAAPEDLERLIAELGLDRPLWRQYLGFLANLATGDLGLSFAQGAPALPLVLQRLPATLELATAAMFLALVFGIPLGMFAGLRPATIPAKTVMSGSIVGVSIPNFWQGLMLIFVFAVVLKWLPSTGRGQTATFLGLELSIWTLDGLRHLLLPAINLSLFFGALVIRLVRASVREIVLLDYVKYARAKGLKTYRIILVHIFKNALIPLITVIGLQFGSLVAFSVITETIFSWPGMGKLLIDSVFVLDRPVVVAFLIVIVIMFITINLIVDLLYPLVDPRIQLSDT